MEHLTVYIIPSILAFFNGVVLYYIKQTNKRISQAEADVLEGKTLAKADRKDIDRITRKVEQADKDVLQNKTILNEIRKDIDDLARLREEIKGFVFNIKDLQKDIAVFRAQLELYHGQPDKRD